MAANASLSNSLASVNTSFGDVVLTQDLQTMRPPRPGSMQPGSRQPFLAGQGINLPTTYSYDQMPSLTQSQFSPSSDTGQPEAPAPNVTLAQMAATYTAQQQQQEARVGSGSDARKGVNNSGAIGEEFESGSETFDQPQMQGSRLDMSATVV